MTLNVPMIKPGTAATVGFDVKLKNNDAKEDINAGEYIAPSFSYILGLYYLMNHIGNKSYI
jgi:hypothetical protein